MLERERSLWNKNISCHYQLIWNVTTISNFWPPNVNEGSPNCDPEGSATTTPRWLRRSWGNAREIHLPLQNVNRETWLASDSWGAYERNKFSEPRGLHLPVQRMLNTDLWCSDCLLLLLQNSIEPDFPSCLLGAVFWVTRMLTPGLRVLNIPTK